jgi:POT family proton-dependent oligopeptide transporter
MTEYRKYPVSTKGMPPGIPYIISNEAAERFSFYGMKAALAIFLANYLGVLGGSNLTETEATSYVSWFNTAVYLTPLLGAIIADAFFGKYRTIVSLSIVYCLGHLCLALMGVGGVVQFWLLGGLGLISLGAGGIKPCVSAHVGDQFGAKNQCLITKIFNIFYFDQFWCGYL